MQEILAPLLRRYIDLKEAAIYLSLSPKCLYEWAASGQIPAHKLGRVWRFDIAELDKFVHSTRSCYNSPQLRSAAGFGQKGMETCL
jgi:excisionase family DNA binding protein